MLATKKGEVPILLQICSKDGLREHLRKMLGDTLHDGKEPRRSAVDYYLSIGWKVGLQWWHQPKGFGTEYVGGCEILTPMLVDDVDNRRQKGGKK
jgi:hypothetical protein